jgi:hypothetical protein
MSSSGYSLTAGWILVIHYIIQLKTFTLSFLQNKKIKLKQVLFCNVISMLQHSDTLPMILIFENTHFWKCDAILEVHIWLGISMSWKANFYCKMLIFVNMSCEFEFRSWSGVLDTTLCDTITSDLRQVLGFLLVLRFPPSIKLTAMI